MVLWYLEARLVLRVEVHYEKSQGLYRKENYALQNGSRVWRLYDEPYSGLRTWLQISMLCLYDEKTIWASKII